MAKTVLLCRVDGNFGGVERVLLSIARGLDRKRHRPVLVPLANDGELARIGNAEGFPVEFVAMRSRFRLGEAASRLMEIARARNADLLHTFGIRSNTLAHHARKSGLNIPWVIRLPNLNCTDYENPLLGRVAHWHNNRMIQKSDALQVISPQLMQYVQQKKIAPEKTYLIPNGADLSRMPKERDRKRLSSGFGIAEDAPLIGSAGRLSAIKGFDVLLQAHQAIAKTHPDARLILIGDGPERSRLEMMASNMDLPHPVVFAGFQRDALPWIKALDVFVCSSHSEGVPNAVLEAMACSIPVVSTQVGGVESVIEHGRDGLLLSPGRPELIADAVSGLLRDRHLANQLAVNAHRRIENEFSSEIMIERVQAMYDEILGGKKGI